VKSSPEGATWHSFQPSSIRTAQKRIGGVVLIRDHIMEESRTKPPAGAMFAINMLVNTRGGDTYTFGEVREGLHKAGFTEVKQVRAGMGMDCLVEGRKPA
jgi:hypothetical protein